MMQNGISKISVYGDSILKGAVTGTESGNLFDIVEENSMALASSVLGFELNNKSVFGNIVTKAQKKLVRDVERRETGELAIIESGGNDCDYDWAEVCASPEQMHLPKVPLTEYLKIVSEMIDVLRENKITPLVMTMPPLVYDRWFNYISKNYDEKAVKIFTKDTPDVLYRNHEIYNLSLLKLCYEKKVQFVDMRLAFLQAENYRELMCMDGIHPNPAGYKFMAQVWENELPKVKLEF